MTSGSLRFEFSDLLDEKKRGETARRWIEAMHIHGVAVVSGVPWCRLPVDRVVLWVWFVKKPALGGRYSANDPCWKAWSEVLQQLASCSLFNTFQYYSILFSTIHHCSLFWKQVDGCQPLQECRSVRVPWRTLPQPWERIFHRVFMDTRQSKQHAIHTFQRRFEMLWRSWCSK